MYFINTGAVIVGLFVYFKTSHKNLHCKAFPGFWRVAKEVVVVHAHTQLDSLYFYPLT